MFRVGARVNREDINPLQLILNSSWSSSPTFTNHKRLFSCLLDTTADIYVVLVNYVHRLTANIRGKNSLRSIKEILNRVEIKKEICYQGVAFFDSITFRSGIGIAPISIDESNA